jgi:thiamine biosynthesis lipoprotein
MKPACAEARRARPLLGTFVEIAAAGEVRGAVDVAIDAAFAVIARVHVLMSAHDPSSDVGRLNRHAGGRAVTVHPWTEVVLRTALELHRASNGIFAVAVTPVRRRGGEAFELVSPCRARVRRPDARIDLGGIAKGFAVDRAIDVLRSGGIVQGIVNAGGDLAAFGPSPEVIHIRDPRDPARAMCLVEVANAALATSGGRFDPTAALVSTESTVIDPRTAAPVTGVLGATVRAHSCMLADALTKIVMAMGEAAMPLLAHYGASALLVSEHGVHISRDWQGGVRLAA